MNEKDTTIESEKKETRKTMWRIVGKVHTNGTCYACEKPIPKGAFAYRLVLGSGKTRCICCADCLSKMIVNQEAFYDLDYDPSLVENFDDSIEDHDAVNHPSHYFTENGMETFDIILAILGKKGTIHYCWGNFIKYISRWKKKNGLEDLEKAQWYLNKMIELVKDDGE